MMGTTTAEAFCFVGCDGTTIEGTHWPSQGPARAVVQIAHGMGEHIGRYAQTAAFLSGHGIAVLGNDHRGHGRTGTASGETGSFGNAGFDGLVADIGLLLAIGRARYPGLPVILLAHSMGSFAAQQLILTQSERLDGVILSGTGALDALFQELEQLNFDATRLTTRSLARVRTSHDWLSREPRAVDAFLDDPLCFAAIDRDAAASVARAAPILADPGVLRAIRPDLPVYCIAGSLDPIGQNSAGVRLLMQRYAAAGLHDVRCVVYEGGRHEMLNETNRGEVLANLLDWIEQTL
jgi:alpha-beta hydrolase superfamily lysophospholipase